MNCSVGQPSNDPKHPDFRPQIFNGCQTVDVEKLRDDLAHWERTKEKNPPVILVSRQRHRCQ